MKEYICSLLQQGIYEMYGMKDLEVISMLETPANLDMGDFSLPCFLLGKRLKKNPVLIGEELGEYLNIKKDNSLIQEVKVLKGYLNIYAVRNHYIKEIMEGLSSDYAQFHIGEGKTVCMDYSSPNIAKNFHVGHLRNTIIGNSLANIYKKLGYRVIRINYLGDWGTQFGKLITAYKAWSCQEEVEKKGIEELLRIYVLFEKEGEKNPDLIEEARSWFAKMEAGDEEALSIWKWFKEISIKEFEQIYTMLQVEFDSYQGESFYMDKVPSLVEELKEKGLLIESEGANIIDLSEFNMPPCLITKRDGSSIYHSRDIAAVLYRKQVYNYDKCLYITGIEQKLHFTQVFKAIEKMGYPWYENLHHISYGLVSMNGDKLSTRKGNVLYAEDILNEAVKRASDAIGEKNPDLSDKENTAKKIGIGAIIFHDLANQLQKDVKFKWEEVLNFDGMTAPYIQYAYARCESLLKKVKLVVGEIDYSYLEDDISYEIVKKLGEYPDIVADAATMYEPYLISRYVYQLAVLFNKFYHQCKIIEMKEDVQRSKLLLVKEIQKIIGELMKLLGIECPKEM